MPCYSPREIYHSKVRTVGINSDGRRLVGLRRVYQVVPCGHCLGCLRTRQMQYAFRAEWESQDPSNLSQYFVTLTFAPEFLPLDNELCKKHIQDYIRRLRNYIPGVRCRYMACGEHGELYGRAHYHLLLWFNDIVPERLIVKAWPFGIVDILPVIPERCGYVAKYSVKQLDDNSENWLVPPFLLISEGVGFYFLEQHGDFCRKNLINTWLNSSMYPVKLPRIFMERLFPPLDGSHLRRTYSSYAARFYYESFAGERVLLKEKQRIAYESAISLRSARADMIPETYKYSLTLRNSFKSYFTEQKIHSRVGYETGRY